MTEPLRPLHEMEESAGVSGRTALWVLLATILTLIVVYELVNWQPSETAYRGIARGRVAAF